MDNRVIGYYLVRFYNYLEPRICYWNGAKFETCRSHFADDEIEKVECSWVDLLENAHMAGQAEAGVDPSYSNARNYRLRIIGG